MRYLLLIIAVLVAFLILKKLYGPRNTTTRKNMPPSTRMVRCDHCGVHIPQDEAIKQEQRYFCSEEHRRLHQP